MRCPRCGFENPNGFKFCGECGAPLSPGVARSVAESPTDGRSQPSGRLGYEGERRQLTVMFCDLVGATALSEQLDPEELREVIREYQEACAQAVSLYEGHIAQYLGDGVLVYFGFPVAHEDDAQRAVFSGLGIVETMRRLSSRFEHASHVRLEVRIGIHTGLVVVGEIGGGDRRALLALGETPNVAARLQSLAEPNNVVISPATHRLIEGFFECQKLGSFLLKGISHPMPVYRVLRESEISGQGELSLHSKLTPLVGKNQEVRNLMGYWEEAKRDQGVTVLLHGEAGIGKSRLLQAFKDRLSGEPHTWLGGRCSPYHQNSALYPVIELLQRVFEFRREDSLEEKRGKIERSLEKYDLALPGSLPFLTSLLSLQPIEHHAALSSPRQKQKTLSLLLELLQRTARREPLLLTVEDLHWADPGTIEMIGLIVEHRPPSVMTLLTCRPEVEPPWKADGRLRVMKLRRLMRHETETMIHQIANNKQLPPEVLQQVVAKTDGIPLYIEELTRMVLESGLLQERAEAFELEGPLPPLAIPTTLQDSLMARLDRLAKARAVAQLGATLGREFTFEMINAIGLLDQKALQHELARLVEAQLLYQEGEPPDAKYTFRHVLIQDIAYQSLLKSTRQQYHARIVQLLVEWFTDLIAAQPELLAHHYTEAGLKETAVVYWQWAAERALQLSANVEAISHLNKGLELLKSIPIGASQLQQELDLQCALGVALIATKGYAAPEVEETYLRAHELCDQLANPPQLAPVLQGLWECYLLRSQLDKASVLGQQLMQLAESSHDSAISLSAHLSIGIVCFYQGEILLARRHLEQGLAIYDPQHHSADAFLYGQDPGVVLMEYLAHVLWMLGYPEQALRKSQEGLALAQKLDHPFSVAFALHFTGELHYHRGEFSSTREKAEALIALCTEQQFSFWLAAGKLMLNSTLAEMGQEKEAVAGMQASADYFKMTGAELGDSAGHAMRAMVYGKTGCPEEGLAAITEAFAVVERSSERNFEPELHRVKGELLLLQPQPDSKAAEECFRKAIAAAQSQASKSWELRANISLCRLLLRFGRRDEACRELRSIYDWFSEGFDTKDLREARALLDGLS